MSNRANLANGYINGSVSAGATSLDLKSGYAGDLPAVPFSATLAPYGQLTSKSNSEIVTVTGVSSDTLTIVRGQRGTTARTFADGDVLAVGVMVEDVVGIDVTVATARTTAAKIGTTADGNYVPCYGDKLNITFTAGCAVNTPTLNIDGSGAKNIRIADVDVRTTTLSTGAVSVTIPLWYDGTYYQMYGSHLNTNTTYTEITSAEITAGTASTARAITGRRSEEIVAKAVTQANSYADTGLATKESLSNKDTDTTLAANSDINYPSQKAVKTYVDTAGWKEIGRVTLSATASSMSVSSLPNYKYLKILLTIIPTGGSFDPKIRFNNDTGNNYSMAILHNIAGVANYSSQPSVSHIQISSTIYSGGIGVIEGTILNVSGYNKQFAGTMSQDGNSSAASQAPVLEYSNGKWVNAAVVNRIDIVKGLGTGNLASGSELIIFGRG